MVAQIDFEGGLEEAWRNVATFVPKLLGFLIILLIGYFIAKALSKLADRLLERIGFDRWVEQGALATGFERAKTDPSNVIGVITFWVVFLITLQLAFGIWGANPVSDLLEGIIAYLPNILVAVVILVIAAALARVVTDVLTPTLAPVQGGSWIAKGAGVAVLVLGIFAALDQLEIAPAIVNGLFYALLIAVVGSIVVAFGGGGIPVAREYLARWSHQAEDRMVDVRDEADPEAGRRAGDRMRSERAAQTSDPQGTGVRGS
jgi:hypothetical protein